MKRTLELEIQPQPDDSTCGPTCLHAVYHYFGDPIALKDVIAETSTLQAGGTLAVQLGCHALRRGYSAALYTCNLTVFDPTWFAGGIDLTERLRAQARVKPDAKLQEATAAYLEFLSLGGSIRFEEFGTGLLRHHLEREIPILTGLSATYLYRCAREWGEEQLDYDDVRGVPTGHFVVLSGFDPATAKVRVADPSRDNPRYGSHDYEVGVERVLGAIFLGVLTYDANLLILEPRPAGAQAR